MKKININGKPFIYQEDIGHCQILDREEARELLLKIKKIFDNNNLLFSLSFGTLLGAVRDNDIIQGDEDVDIFTVDEKKLISLIPLLWENGLKIFRHWEKHIYSFRYKNSCSIDVYIMAPYKFSIWGIFCYRIHRFAIPKKYFEKFDSIDFLGTTFRVPQNPIELLKFWYGDTWNIPISKRVKKYRYEIYPAYLCHMPIRKVSKLCTYLITPKATIHKIKNKLR
jgi:phosphorylcholine metabolism protein LicD